MSISSKVGVSQRMFGLLGRVSRDFLNLVPLRADAKYFEPTRLSALSTATGRHPLHDRAARLFLEVRPSPDPEQSRLGRV
jgi:hypothetical protein